MIAGTEHAELFVPRFLRLYEEEIKPAIKRGAYILVHAALDNPMTYMEQFGTAILLATEGEMNLLANIRRLYQETSEGHAPSDSALRNLEVFVRQHNLKESSLKTD